MSATRDHAVRATMLWRSAWRSDASAVASAQTYPSKPIHIVVPFSPGGITDVLGRALGAAADRGLRPAGGDREQAGRRRPGRHRLRRQGRARRPHAAGDRRRDLRHQSAHLQPSCPIDPVNDFAPITGLGISPQALVVNPSVPVRTFAELIALAKQEAGRDQLRDLRHRHQRPPQHHAAGEHDRHQVHAGALPRRRAGHHRRDRRPHPDDDREHRAGGAAVAGGPAQGARLRQQRRGCRNIPTCRPSRRAVCRATRPARGTAWRRPRARRARSSTSSMRKSNASSTTRAFATDSSTPNFIYSIVSSPEIFAERIRADSAKWGKVVRDAKVKVE